MKRPRVSALSALLLGLLSCDLGDGDGDTDTEGDTESETASTTGFDPSGGPGGEFIPTAGASGATFTAGANSGSNPTVGTSSTTAAVSTTSTTTGASATCQMPCIGDTDCDVGQSCLDTSDGSLCIPTQCQTCFDQNGSCESNTSTCEYLGCDVDPNSTCESPCTTAAECNAGEACLDTATMGRICLPALCDGCFASQGFCSWNAMTCEYTDCQPQ